MAPYTPRSVEDKCQAAISALGDANRLVGEPGREEMRIGGALLEALGDLEVGGGVDEITENGAGADVFVVVAEQLVQAARP